MPDVYLHEHTIRNDEIDVQGHVNNLRFLHWMIDAAVAHSSAQGWSHDDYQRLGAAWVVRSHQIKYLQSAYADEAVVVRTWVASMKRFSSVRKYRIHRLRDDSLLASAETEWVLVNLNTRALAPIPQKLSSSFTIVEKLT